MACNPSHHWQPWKFKVTSKGWWAALASGFARGEEKANASLREYLETFMAKELGISSLAEWNSVNETSLSPSLTKRLNHFGGLKSILTRLYPNYSWTMKPNTRPNKSANGLFLWVVI